MTIIRNRETLEPALLQVPAGGMMVVLVVTAHGCEPDPAHQPGQGRVGAGPEDQMPMVAHPAIGPQVHRLAFQRRAEDGQESPVAAGLVAQAHAPVAAVADVVEGARFDGPPGSWHGPIPEAAIKMSDVPILFGTRVAKAGVIHIAN